MAVAARACCGASCAYFCVWMRRAWCRPECGFAERKSMPLCIPIAARRRAMEAGLFIQSDMLCRAGSERERDPVPCRWHRLCRVAGPAAGGRASAPFFIGAGAGCVGLAMSPLHAGDAPRQGREPPGPVDRGRRPWGRLAAGRRSDPYRQHAAGAGARSSVRGRRDRPPSAPNPGTDACLRCRILGFPGLFSWWRMLREASVSRIEARMHCRGRCGLGSQPDT